MLAEDFTLTDRPLVARVIRLYWLLLNRAPDPGGLRTYVACLRRGDPLEAIAAIFLAGDEFRTRHSKARTIDAAAIVELYRGAFGIAPPPGGFGSAVPAFVARIIEADEADGRTSALPALRGARVDDRLAYRWWTEERDFVPPGRRHAIAALIEELQSEFGPDPTFSLVMPLDKPRIEHLRGAIRSVREQLYPAFELMVTTNERLDPSLAEFLADEAGGDSRIRLAQRSAWPGRLRAINRAIRGSRGMFVGMLGPSDLLAPAATLELALAARRFPNAQVIYSDEDALTADGIRHSPRFKTDWDPDRMSVQDHLGRLTMFRSRFVRRLGGLRGALDGAELDLARRAAFAVSPAEIRHVPHVLYHRRDEGLDAVLPAPPRIVHLLPAEPPLVSIVIPTRDRLDLLKPCVDGLLERTAYRRIEVIVVDNASGDNDAREYLRGLAGGERTRVLAYDAPFNWSAASNQGVAASHGEVILLLNNDTEVIHADWLDEIVGQALRADVGAVGAKLLYAPDGTLQHGGILLAPNGAGRHVFRHAAGDDRGYLDQLAIVRTVSAVTGACIAMRRAVFDEVGGLEQDALRVTNSDVDLCLRVGQHGYRVVWTPFARLWHKELATRGADDTPAKASRAAKEQAHLARIWAERLREDPYWNPNLEVSEAGALLAVRPRAQRAWEMPASAQRGRRGAVAVTARNAEQRPALAGE